MIKQLIAFTQASPQTSDDNQSTLALKRDHITVFRLFLVSTVLVIVARLLAPVSMNWDEAVQLEAAHRLIQGQGLTSTFFPPPFAPDAIPSNLNQAPLAEYLTWWPPGFSLLVGSLLAFGLSLASSLKLIYGAATVIGWWGWAKIAQYCLTNPVQIGSIALPVHLAIAVLLPIFHTPSWIGTDIFLWAAIPFMVLLLFNSVTQWAWAIPHVAIAGLVFGFQFSLRYAVLFFAIVALITLFQIHFPDIKTFIQRYLIFTAASLIVAVPTIAYLAFANAQNHRAGILPFMDFNNDTGLDKSSLGAAVRDLFHSASTIANISSLPIQTNLSYQIEPNPFLYVAGTFFLIATFALPIIIFTRVKQPSLSDRRFDLTFILSSIPAALVLFLLISTLKHDYNYLGTPRYYLPAVLPTLFVCYELATAKVRDSYRFMKFFMIGFITVFLWQNLIVTPKWLAPGVRVRLAQQVLDSYSPKTPYPSNDVLALYSETSKAVRQLQRDNPNALFFIQDYAFYVYDGHDGLRVIPTANTGFWERAYLERPTQIFWVVSRSKCPTICADHSTEPIPQLSSLPNLNEVFASEREKTRILSTNLPGGYQFSSQ